MTSRRNVLTIAVFSVLSLLFPPRTVQAAGAASEQTAGDVTSSTQVAVVVKISIPPGIDRAQIEAGMSKTVPLYQNLPGLIRKYFIISDDQKLGGIYLWQNRKTAEAWYSEDWRAQVMKKFGSPAELTYFDVPIAIEAIKPQKIASEQPSAGAAPSSKVAVLVEGPIPPGVSRAQIEAGMSKAVPLYQNLPGLMRKYFIISEDQKLGGIYLWENRKTAEAWYNESVVWHAGVSKTFGTRAEITYFDVPIVTEGLKSQQ